MLATAAAADSRRCATCSVQQRSRGSRGSGKTFDGGTAYSHLSASDHRRKDAQCIRYASCGSVATRTCVGLQRGLPGRRRAWQVQVALNRCYYMLNRRRRLTSATPSVLGDAIWFRCGECGAGSRCMQDLMKRGERRTIFSPRSLFRSFLPPPTYLCTSFSLLALSRRGLSRRDLDPSATATRPHTDHRLVRYDSGMTSPFS